MQSHLLQNTDLTDQLDALKECMPFLDQVIDTNFSVDFYQTNQNLTSLILQKCLTELKEHKTTIASQEDILQSATEKLISLRDDNSHLNESNNNLINQVNDLKRFLDEADLIATGLRLEVNQLKNENYVLKDRYHGFDFPNETNSLKSLLTQGEQAEQMVIEKEEGPMSENLLDKSLEQSLFIEALQQKENMIKDLTQNVQDLAEYKEKYLRVLQENDSYKLIEEHNKNLSEELLMLREENKNLLTRSPGDIFKRLKPIECYQFPDKASTSQTEIESSRRGSIMKEEDCKNKNYLALKGFAIASPSKENVDIKKGNLLTETILLNSAKRPSSPLKKNTSQRPPISSAHIPRRVKDFNFGNGFTKNSEKAVETSLVEGISRDLESESEEIEVRQVKTEKDLVSSLRILGESQTSRKDRSYPSARKIDDRASFRDSPCDGNTSKASDDHCFDGMLSWEEGDFPRLNCSGMVCPSPKMESNLNFNQDMANLKQELMKNLLENQNIIDDGNKKEVVNTVSSLLTEDCHKGVEKARNTKKAVVNEAIQKPSKIQKVFKEIMTQTEGTDNQSVEKVDIESSVPTHKRAQLNWSGIASIVSLIFSLIIISFFTKQVNYIDTSL